MQLPAMVSLALILWAGGTSSCPGQEPKPAPATAGAGSAKTNEGVFDPGPSAGITKKRGDELVAVAAGWLLVDWVDREKPKAQRKAADEKEELEAQATLMLRARLYAKALASPDTRSSVLASTLATEEKIHVLPLGRIVWERPAAFVKSMKAEPVPYLAVLLATESEPKEPWRTATVKGEWRDAAGKKVADFSAKSLNARPENGVFLVGVPAGAATKELGAYEAFQFHLKEAKVQK
jgi:hypothetical protein